MAEVLSVLTYKAAETILEDKGTQSWVIKGERAEKCSYVVCVRHRKGPYKAEGDEPHKHAFLVGKVSGVEESTETKGRIKVKFSEYALLNGPEIPLASASPTQYFPSLKTMGIDEGSLVWHSVANYQSSSGVEGNLSPETGNHKAVDEGDADHISPMSVLMKAKKFVAESLQIPVSSVEITIRT